MKYIIFIILLLSITSSLLALDTKATHAIIVDFDTKDILFSKKHNDFTPPASMTKIMTSYIVFDHIKNGYLSLDDIFTITLNAYKMGGSRMFLERNSKVTVKDLLNGMIIQSGNDASVAIAENISGTEKEFAILMNKYAIKLGMKNTYFVNSSGWPNLNHYSSMFDLYLLSHAIINDFPELYKLFSGKRFKYNNITQPNRNTLLSPESGIDGLKTGFVQNSGYGIAVSAIKDNRRIIVVINGLKSSRERKEEAQKLINWTFTNTSQITLLKKGQKLGETDVWLGKEKTVNLISSETIITALTFDQSKNVKINISYDKPLEAPVNKNQEVGLINIQIPNKKFKPISLVTDKEIKIVNPLIRIFSALNYLVLGNIEND